MASGRAAMASSNRSTENVFKPPPTDGTTSPQRALRWQGKEGGGQEEAAPDNVDARSETSASTNKTSKSSKSNASKSSSKSRRAREAAKGPKVPGTVDWFGDPLNPGIDASLGPGGSLYSFTSKGKPRAGMCNPPMNEKVRAALVADLNKWKVDPIVQTKKDKEKEEKQAKEKRAKKFNIMVPPAGVGVGMEAKPERTIGGFEVHDDSQSGSNSRAGTAPRRSASVPSLHRGSSPHTKSRRRKGEAGLSFDLEEGKPKKYGLDTAPEGEVKFRSRMLQLQSREHGKILDKMETADVAYLSTYHNSFSRGPLAHPHQPPHPVAPARLLKDIGHDLINTSQSLDRLSDYTVQSEFSPSRRRRLPGYNLGPASEAPSMERLMEMAGHVMHANPNNLDRMCKVGRISVRTGGKLPDFFDASMGSLESPTTGVTPRTSTGVPLPVPYWGKNGNAPELREAPELQRARLAFEEGY